MGINETRMTAHEVAKLTGITNHLKILELKKKRIDRLINLVKDTLDGKSNCSFEAFSKHEILEAQANKAEKAEYNILLLTSFFYC